MPGTRGRALKRMRSIQKGTTPIQAEPSKVSGTRPAGSRRAMDAAGTGQWAKSRSFHRWVTVQWRLGRGVGRCPVILRMSCTSVSLPSRERLEHLSVIPCAAKMHPVWLFLNEKPREQSLDCLHLYRKCSTHRGDLGRAGAAYPRSRVAKPGCGCNWRRRDRGRWSEVAFAQDADVMGHVSGHHEAEGEDGERAAAGDAMPRPRVPLQAAKEVDAGFADIAEFFDVGDP